MEGVLIRRVPSDLARYIVEIAAATRIQAIARGSLARIHRLPMGRHGFQKIGDGAYKYAGSDFARDLYLWMASFRPNAYSVSDDRPWAGACAGECMCPFSAVPGVGVLQLRLYPVPRPPVRVPRPCIDS